MFAVWFSLAMVGGLLQFGECSNCSAPWEQYQDERCIRAFPTQPFQNFTEAQKFCESNSATLVTIRDENYDQFVTWMVFNSSDIYDSMWIGAKKIEGGNFEWVDVGDLTGYENWAPNNPRENVAGDRCIEIMSPHVRSNRSPAQWYDVACGKRNMIVCQKSPNWTLDYTVNEVIKLRARVDKLEQGLFKKKLL